PAVGYSVPSFDGFVTLGCCFTPVSGWDGYTVRFDPVAQDTYPFWTEPINQRWLVVLACPEYILSLTKGAVEGTLQPQLRSSLTLATCSTG
ncbi:MAG TPA: hypothetical protein VGD99_28665, partial [Anaerolineae bacterium]